jgi:cell division protein FtsW
MRAAPRGACAVNEKRTYDRHLFCVTIFLVALGLIMVMSASLSIAQERFSSPYFFLQKHAIRVVLGMCLMIVFMRIPFGVFRRFAPWILVSAFVLLVALFPWGVRVRGSCRWLSLPVLNCTVQPVEIAKFALILYLAARVADLKKRITDLRSGFLPLVAVAVCMAVLVALQPNFSNALFLLILALAMLFIGGCRIIHLFSFGAGITGIAFVVMSRFPHVQERIKAFLDRAQDLHGMNWHINQSLIALGSGFIMGCGPGRGHQKYSFLPDAHTDFIYSIIGEEFGLLGTLVVLALFVFIFVRAVRAAVRAPNSFGYLLALGFGISITTAALINVAMTLGIVPTAGLPLPFVSYGGSSLLTAMASIGILLNISAEGRGDAGPFGRPHPPRTSAGGVYARRVQGRRKKRG